jgi:hypothetical protein
MTRSAKALILSTPILPATLASGKKLSKKQPPLARPFGVFGWMIHGEGVFLRAYHAEAGANGDDHPRTVERPDVPLGRASRDSPVTKPGAPVVIVDEMPEFLDRGHRLELPRLDRWIASRLISMGDDFAGLIERHRKIDIAGDWPRPVRQPLRNHLARRGYLLVGTAPERTNDALHVTRDSLARR